MSSSSSSTPTTNGNKKKPTTRPTLSRRSSDPSEPVFQEDGPLVGTPDILSSPNVIEPDFSIRGLNNKPIPTPSIYRDARGQIFNLLVGETTEAHHTMNGNAKTEERSNYILPNLENESTLSKQLKGPWGRVTCIPTLSVPLSLKAVWKCGYHKVMVLRKSLNLDHEITLKYQPMFLMSNIFWKIPFMRNGGKRIMWLAWMDFDIGMCAV